MISEYENTNPKDKFITVEKKQIRFQKVWNPEIQSENKSGKGPMQKIAKKINYQVWKIIISVYFTELS